MHPPARPPGSADRIGRATNTTDTTHAMRSANTHELTTEARARGAGAAGAAPEGSDLQSESAKILQKLMTRRSHGTVLEPGTTVSRGHGKQHVPVRPNMQEYWQLSACLVNSYEGCYLLMGKQRNNCQDAPWKVNVPVLAKYRGLAGLVPRASRVWNDPKKVATGNGPSEESQLKSHTCHTHRGLSTGRLRPTTLILPPISTFGGTMAKIVT